MNSYLKRTQNVKRKSPVWLFINENQTNFKKSPNIIKPKFGNSQKNSSLTRNTSMETFKTPIDKFNSNEIKIIKKAISSNSTPISPRFHFDEDDPFYQIKATNKRQKEENKKEPEKTSISNKIEDDFDDVSLFSFREDDEDDYFSLFDSDEKEEKRKSKKDIKYYNDNIDYNQMVMDEIHDILIENQPNLYTAKPFNYYYNNENISNDILNEKHTNKRNSKAKSSIQKKSHILNEISSHFHPKYN